MILESGDQHGDHTLWNYHTRLVGHTVGLVSLSP